MRLKVSKSVLDKAIKSVIKAVPAKGVQPILNNILLTNNESFLKLNATDLDFSIEATIPSFNEQLGSITVSAKKLDEIVSKLDDDDIFINADLSNNNVQITCRQSSFDLIGVEASEFPEIQKPDIDSFFTLNRDQFNRIINMVHLSASRYDINNILGGIYFSSSKDDKGMILEAASTDGNRLSCFEYLVDAQNSSMSKKSAVIPLKVILDVQKILDSSVDDKIKISFLENQVLFLTDDRYVVSRLLEGVYPSYKQLIPSDQDKIAQLDRKTLLSSLERVSVMANEITNLVRLSFSQAKLSIETSNKDYGYACEDMNVDYTGEDLDIHFNVKFIIEILKTLDSEQIQFSLKGPLNAVIIKPVSDENYIHLVMPIKHDKTIEKPSPAAAQKKEEAEAVA